MATPISGEIKFSQFNTEIMSASSTAERAFSSIRTIFGLSGEIKMSDMYKCWGILVTCGTTSSKGITYAGFATNSYPYPIGSVNDQYPTGPIPGSGTQLLNRAVSISATNTRVSFASASMETGWTTDLINRISISNTSLSIWRAGDGVIPPSDPPSGYFDLDFGTNTTFPTSGVVPMAIRWS